MDTMVIEGKLLAQYFMGGAIMMACAACGLIFLKSWRATRDRLFFLFALAFFFLGMERVVLAIVTPPNEFRFYVYLIRLIAFVLIMVAIIDKNRKSNR